MWQSLFTIVAATQIFERRNVVRNSTHRFCVSAVVRSQTHLHACRDSSFDFLSTSVRLHHMKSPNDGDAETTLKSIHPPAVLNLKYLKYRTRSLFIGKTNGVVLIFVITTQYKCLTLQITISDKFEYQRRKRASRKQNLIARN